MVFIDAPGFMAICSLHSSVVINLGTFHCRYPSRTYSISCVFIWPFILLESQPLLADPSYTCQGMQNHATLSSGSSTLSGHRARSPVYAVVDEEDLLTQDPHCSHTLPMHQCTIVSNPAVSTLPPQPYASTQLYPPQNVSRCNVSRYNVGRYNVSRYNVSR